MTINHLLNLKTKTKNFAKEGIDLGMSSDLVDWSADVQHLIDKEIARKEMLSQKRKCGADTAAQPLMRSAT